MKSLSFLTVALLFLPTAVGAAEARLAGLDLDVSLDPERGVIQERARLTIEAESAAELTFELGSDFVVEKVEAGDRIVEYRKAGPRVRVAFSPPLAGREEVVFRVSGTPRRNGKPLIGPRWAALGGDDRWYPTLPLSWGPATLTLRLPQGWRAIGNGRSDAADGGRWRTSAAVRHVAFVASPQLAPLRDGKVVDTPLTLSLAGGEVDTTCELFERPLAWFSAGRRPYAFERFNLAFVPGLTHRVQGSGFLALPTGTPLATQADAADLIAGQWYGEWLAGDGRWMEAFAASDALEFARDREPPTELERLRSDYRALPRREDVPLSRASTHTPATIVRGKGSAAPAMIREIVGTRGYYRAIQELFDGPPAPRRSLRGVRDVFEKHAGNSLLRAFSEWFDRTGVPAIQADLRTLRTQDGNWRADILRTQDGNWRADITLRQTESIYALPLEVVLLGPGQQHRETIRLEDELTTVYYILPFEPVRLRVDPLNRLFLRAEE
jgi:hypothetical protein